MLVGRMVDDKVDQHAQAALLAAMGEIDEIAERAVARIDRRNNRRCRSRRRDPGEVWNGISQIAVAPRP